MSPLSRRSILRRGSLGISVVLAGCSAATEATQPSPPSDPTRSPSPCSEEMVAVNEVREAELEAGTYELVQFKNLSATQQQTFEQARRDDRAPLVKETESWYRYVEYQNHEQRLSMVVRYNETFYEIEVHHLDYY